MLASGAAQFADTRPSASIDGCTSALETMTRELTGAAESHGHIVIRTRGECREDI